MFFFCLACASEKDRLEKSMQAEQEFNESLKAASLNSRVETLDHLQNAINLDPLEPKYHTALGQFYLGEKEDEKAERAFLQSIKLDDTLHEPYKQLGRLYLERGEMSQAIQYLKQSLEKQNVTSPQQIYNWLAIAYYQQKDFNNAENAWLTGLRLRENENLRLNLALAYRDREQFDKAMDSLKRAVSIKPEFAPAHYHLALLYLKRKDLKLATRHFNRVIQLTPRSEQAKASMEYLALIKTEQ